jgi:hypothetical protein
MESLLELVEEELEKGVERYVESNYGMVEQEHFDRLLLSKKKKLAKLLAEMVV